MSRRRALRQLLIAIMFTVVGIWMTLAGAKVTGAFVWGFFGILGLPVFATMLIRAPTLTLDQNGFEVKMVSKRGSYARAWNECGPFQAWSPGTVRPAAVTYSTVRADQRALRSVSRSLAAGNDEGIALGYGGLSAKDLADLMNAYRSSALSAADGADPARD